MRPRCVYCNKHVQEAVAKEICLTYRTDICPRREEQTAPRGEPDTLPPIKGGTMISDKGGDEEREVSREAVLEEAEIRELKAKVDEWNRKQAKLLRQYPTEGKGIKAPKPRLT